METIINLNKNLYWCNLKYKCQIIIKVQNKCPKNKKSKFKKIKNHKNISNLIKLKSKRMKFHKRT